MGEFKKVVYLMIFVPLLIATAGVLTPVREDVCGNSRDGRRAADLRATQAALEAYYRDHQSYPSTESRWQGDAAAYGEHGYGSDGYIPGLVPDYMQTLPKDPDNTYPTRTEGYRYRSDGVDYKLVVNTAEDFPSGNPFYDRVRPRTSWQVSTVDAWNW